MNYLSVCSGIEAATCAWHDLGWTPEAFSEIEKFPSEVLAHHYPNVPNLGDMTKFKEWNLEPIDLLVGGTPCQSFSVAGLRKGLDDPRGNLALVYLAIADRFKPKWVVWENVPGVLSSNGGRDFGAFLGALGQLGYGFAYRVLDAQWFGVAQRRRRVFVVGCLGDWRRAAAVLFESQSLRWDLAPSRKTGQKAAPTVVQGAPYSRTGNDRVETDAIVCMSHGQANAEVRVDGVCPTLTCLHEAPIAFDTTQITSPHNYSNPKSGDPCHPLAARAHVPAIAQPVAFPSVLSNQNVSKENLSPTLEAKNPTAVAQSMAVRRLTPTECERLQGFPDGYTNIKEKCPDGPRYKALGNSMAVPVMKWIGKRIYERKTMDELCR